MTKGDCVVCNATRPCLYELLADPSETTNVADAHPEVVAALSAALAAASTYYVSGTLPARQLHADYVAINATTEWAGFMGPCYVRRDETRGAAAAFGVLPLL